MKAQRIIRGRWMRGAGLPLGWVAIWLMGLLVCGQPCGALTVTIGTYRVEAPAGLLRIPVQVTGGEAISELSAVVAVSGGGILFEGAPGPGIAAIDFAGSIWGTNALERIAFGDDPQGAQHVEPSVALVTPGRTIAANGILFTVVLDLTGWTNGSFPLQLSLGPKSPGPTRLYRQGEEIPAQLQAGRLEVFTPSAFSLSFKSVSDLSGWVLQWPTRIGKSYVVSQTDSLLVPRWVERSGPIAGTGAMVDWPIPINLQSATPTAFFRVQER